MVENIKLRFRSYDHKVLDRAVNDIVKAVMRCGANLSGPISIPTKIQKFTVNKSTNIDKKSREQFEIRKHMRLLYIESSVSVVEALMNIQAPAGVDIEIKIT
jgi:small subunit ribosomal protein S10